MLGKIGLFVFISLGPVIIFSMSWFARKMGKEELHIQSERALEETQSKMPPEPPSNTSSVDFSLLAILVGWMGMVISTVGEILTIYMIFFCLTQNIGQVVDIKKQDLILEVLYTIDRI